MRDVLRPRSRRELKAQRLKQEIEVLDQWLRVLDRWSVKECLSAEAALDDRHFVLAAGRWFEVGKDRLSEIRARIERIPVLAPGDLGLPPWASSDDESAYNKSAADQPGGRLRLIHHAALDRTPGERGGIEVCDLIDNEMRMVCVKKLRRSTELSHLFAQGSVSAELYHRDPKFRGRAAYEFRSGWPDRAMPAAPTVVYAIATEREGPLTELIPFFSKINLVTHAERVQRHAHLDVSLTKIEVRTHPPLPPYIPFPRTDGEQHTLFDDTEP